MSRSKLEKSLRDFAKLSQGTLVRFCECGCGRPTNFPWYRCKQHGYEWNVITEKPMKELTKYVQ